VADYVKTDMPGLVLDPKTGAILNVDSGKLREYRLRKKSMRRMEETHKRVDRLERDVADIKAMLREILEAVGK
jgi:hypothetical protein